MNPPHIVVRRAAEHRPAKWKNGRGATVEIARSPPDATLETFDWRVSMAAIETDGPFSQFDGMERGLIVLDGELQLAVGHSPATVLTSESGPLRFPGEIPVFAAPQRGAVVDLNVMTRRGRFEQSIERRTFSREIQLDLDCDVCVVVFRKAEVSVTSLHETFLMGVDDALIIHAARMSLALVAAEPATVIAVKMKSIR